MSVRIQSPSAKKRYALDFHFERRGAHGRVVPGRKGKIMSESFFTRSSLDERIFAANGGAELIPLPLLPRFIHIQYQSIKNLISKGQFPLPVVKLAGRNYVKTETLVRFLQSCEHGQNVRKKVGRKSNKERAQNQPSSEAPR